MEQIKEFSANNKSFPPTKDGLWLAVQEQYMQGYNHEDPTAVIKVKYDGEFEKDVRISWGWAEDMSEDIEKAVQQVLGQIGTKESDAADAALCDGIY
ncbi:MAG: hypothetical protein AAB556_00150 [Patescibacteria group bacterium]